MQTAIKLIFLSTLLSGCISVVKNVNINIPAKDVNLLPISTPNHIAPITKCAINKIIIEETPLIPFLELDKLKDKQLHEKNIILAKYISDLRKYISKLKTEVFDFEISVQKCL